MSSTTSTPLDRVEQAAAQILGDAGLVVVDVGAAFGLPPHLSPLRHIASTICCFEPDPEAAEALSRLMRERGQTNVKVFPVALASSEAERTLYVTNVPTGSSLLKPGNDFADSFGVSDYFYPMRETVVKTRPLRSVLVEGGVPRADTIKIDVQGAELEVLTGLGAMLAETTLAVELEIGFPGCYIDQPGFGEIDAFMNKAGFLLYDLRPASHHPHLKGDFGYYPREVFRAPAESNTLTKRITEADGVYFRRPELMLGGNDANAVRRQLVLLCVYGFFIDALQLIDRATAAKLLSENIARNCREGVLAWHGGTRDLLADNPRFDRFVRYARQWSVRFQRKLFGQRFYRWRE
jgi:FkbM family methyltransferase